MKRTLVTGALLLAALGAGACTPAFPLAPGQDGFQTCMDEWAQDDKGVTVSEAAAECSAESGFEW